MQHGDPFRPNLFEKNDHLAIALWLSQPGGRLGC
jgi:hypothetical protein